jgi:L-ascorbate metabolism protein UlaG (beta-lactamase superfamily)
VDTIAGNPQAFVHPSSATVGRWSITGIDVAHDDEGGRSRGKNTVIVLDDGDVRVVHLGDLGHTLDAHTVAAIGRTDVLLVPVGGFFTIDHAQAAEVVDSLDPRIVIPMHYKTPKADFPISGVEPFLATQTQVEHKSTSTIEITGATLPAARVVYVLPPDR